MNDNKAAVNRIFRIIILSLCCFPYTTGATEAESYAQRSVLATGKWVKIQVETTGMYKITDDDLKKMGFADPKKVSVHGYGGWLLDEDFRKPYVDDLPAVAIYRGSNYLLFFGKGTVKWEYSEQENTFIHTNNPYATAGYYFLTDGTAPEEMEELAATAGGASLTINSFDEYRVFEEDLASVNNSGRELFGESFATGGSHTIASPVFRIPGVTDEDGKLSMRFIARPKSTAGIAALYINGNPLLEIRLPAVNSGSESSYIKATAGTATGIWKGSKSENPVISLSYNKAGDENVHLDYIRLHVKRELRQYGACTFFRSISSRNNVSRFVIRDADESTVVFDVTDGINPKRMATLLNGTELSFSIPAGNLREFAAVQINREQGAWKIAGEAGNQDLHALPQTDMIIIAQDALRSQAERLAERHRKDNLSVEVVNPQQIYNEFSSGTPDATAYRRFMKMFYDRSASEAARPKYLLLFGDGAYDNRTITAGWKNVVTSNMLLTYQSENSLNQYSYVTDDYFGALGDTPFDTGPIQLGIGRFPVRTIEEATVAVDKVLSYMDNASTGAWKNRICFVADDGSAADSYSNEHMEYADSLSERLRRRHPGFLVGKIFFDAYKKNSSTYPDVRQNIQKQLKDGLLVINYTGHGSTEQWSDEKVLSATADIAHFSYPCLPLWITATCDFTRFDHTSTSAGERVFLQKSGGIAMFTTTRVVYSTNNFQLNNYLLEELFYLNKEGRHQTLGEVIRNTKSKLYDTNKFNFILIGDPAMKLSYPEYRMQATTINGKPLHADEPVTFKALEKITVEGNILLPDGSELASDFSGSLFVSVLDSKQTIRTLDNNQTGNLFEFTDYPNTLYKGNAKVNDGVFSFSFTVPRTISYSNDYGVMNLYAVTDDSAKEAQGYFGNFLVGGSAEDPEEDTEGPEVRQIYLNDSTFTDGGQVNVTPFFVARLWDQTGVSISGGSIGHDIMLSIDNKPAWSYNLNAYYQLLPDADGSGQVSFSLPALPPGMHTAEFKVWDVADNSTLYTFSFEVVEGLKPEVARIVASPVPAREGIRFYIYHNRPESVLQVDVMVYDMTGRLQWTTQKTGSSGVDAPYTVEWNLTSNSGSRLRPGVYIYCAAIRTDHSREATRSGKLVILAQ
jgi:hypothetical protein